MAKIENGVKLFFGVRDGGKGVWETSEQWHSKFTPPECTPETYFGCKLALSDEEKKKLHADAAREYKGWREMRFCEEDRGRDHQIWVKEDVACAAADVITAQVIDDLLARTPEDWRHWEYRRTFALDLSDGNADLRDVVDLFWWFMDLPAESAMRLVGMQIAFKVQQQLNKHLEGTGFQSLVSLREENDLGKEIGIIVTPYVDWY